MSEPALHLRPSSMAAATRSIRLTSGRDDAGVPVWRLVIEVPRGCILAPTLEKASEAEYHNYRNARAAARTLRDMLTSVPCITD